MVGLNFVKIVESFDLIGCFLTGKSVEIDLGVNWNNFDNGCLNLRISRQTLFHRIFDSFAESAMFRVANRFWSYEKVTRSFCWGYFLCVSEFWSCSIRLIRATAFKMSTWWLALICPISRSGLALTENLKRDSFSCSIAWRSYMSTDKSRRSPEWLSSRDLISVHVEGFLEFTRSSALPWSLFLMWRSKSVFWFSKAISLAILQ